MQISTVGVLREEERVAQTAGRTCYAHESAFDSGLVAASETADKWFIARTIGLVLWPHAARIYHLWLGVFSLKMGIVT